MAILSIISIFLILLDFAAVISIDQPTSKWFWINAGIVVYFAIAEHVTLDTAFWWVISTASTVGYDAIFGKTIPPHSIVGKFVTLITMLLGIGIVGMLTSSITSYLMRRTNGAHTHEAHDNIELILKKLDNIEKQNEALTDQNKKMQAEIEKLKAEQNSNELSKIKDWFEKRKDN